MRRGASTKLTEDEVKAIRSAPASMMTKDLAQQYGMSESHMSRIRRGVKYKIDG
jgi:hypothetical protein